MSANNYHNHRGGESLERTKRVVFADTLQTPLKSHQNSHKKRHQKSSLKKDPTKQFLITSPSGLKSTFNSQPSSSQAPEWKYRTLQNFRSAKRSFKGNQKTFKLKKKPKNASLELLTNRIESLNDNITHLLQRKEDEDFLKKIDDETREFRKKIRTAKKSLEKHQTVSLRSLFKNYFTEVEDPAIMRMANSIYMQGGIKRRNRILLMSQDSALANCVLSYKKYKSVDYKVVS